MKDKELEEKTIQIKELIAERMVSSVRFLFASFLDTDFVDVNVSRDGVMVVSEIAGMKYGIEPVNDVPTLWLCGNSTVLKKYTSFTIAQRKEYGDREAMKLVYTVLVNLYAGGHIPEKAFRQEQLLVAIKRKLNNYRVIGNVG